MKNQSLGNHHGLVFESIPELTHCIIHQLGVFLHKAQRIESLSINEAASSANNKGCGDMSSARGFCRRVNVIILGPPVS